MTDSSKLCLSCGLCCDGTLIGHVQLDPEELLQVKSVMEIEDENSNGFFLQPCKKYCDGCTIYSQRPTPCASFKCGLLNSFDMREISFSQTAEIIKEVKKQKAAIEKNILIHPIELQSQSFYFKMVELSGKLNRLKRDTILTEGQDKLLGELKQLNQLVEKRFGVTLD